MALWSLRSRWRLVLLSTGASCASLLRGVAGCSFLATTASWDASNLEQVNEFMRRRGPDGTRCARLRGVVACHNLLHMTGDLAPQPFVDEAGGVIALFNGEIYNYALLARQLGIQARSDGEVLLPLYERFGEAVPRLLDGEFAIAIFDLDRRIAVLATDAFSTKPLWYSRTGGGLRIATYRSAVERLGAPEGSAKMVDPNSVMLFGLDPSGPGGTVPILGRAAVFEFDTRQFKNDVGDFLVAFQRAVDKRMRSNHAVFIGLSSGYDSGAIQVALARAGQAHAAYTIYSTEDVPTLEKRVAWTGNLVEPNLIVLSEDDRQHEEFYLRRNCEHFDFSGLGRLGALVDDPASHGLSFIFREVRQRGMLVYLSGTGADEIISDYGFAGKKFFPHSNFGGLFPEDLQEIFPWASFFLGTQRDYLMKEELVAGTHGIEGRYPFLDRSVVQEYLWLSPALKNSVYKAPLHALLEGVGYPFIQGEKVGFNADWNVRAEGESIVLSTHGDGLFRREAVPPTLAPTPPTSSEDADDEEALLATQEVDISRSEAEFDEALQDTKMARERLLSREEAFVANVASFDSDRLQRIQAYLLVMLPRFARMRYSAEAAAPQRAAAAMLAAEEPEFMGRPVHPRWRSVEVVTCVSGGQHLMIADFPAFEIFRDTTPLPVVHNICENIEWEGMHFRLRAYARFFREALLKRRPGQLPTLYLVSDGMDVFFNDMSEVIAPLADDGDRAERRPASTPGDETEEVRSARAAARATARLVAERYEAIAGSGSTRKPIVVSTERLCGWGGAKLCSDEDEARYPPSPTDSKYLNAGGYIGPADAISSMIEAVLTLKENADEVDMEKGRDSDQYFFKRYFWDHQDMIALDYHQSIFGNFLEIVNKPCESDWVPQCAVKPCCTESDHFKSFHKTFYGRYEVRGCAVWRDGQLPVSWHGNGAGKWLWLLALDRLALQCGTVANLTLARYPDDMLRGVFEKFEKRSNAEGGLWPGGFLLREPAALAEAPEGGIPAECVG